MSLDGSNVVYAAEFKEVHETGNTSITDPTDTKVATASGGVSQTDFDSQVATLQSKDVAYSNKSRFHMSLIDTNTTDIATHTNDISVLNTTLVQNFAGINDINTNLTNNYEASSQLATNFYNTAEIDTTLGNSYTITNADTSLFSKPRINNNIYTKN